ncbi:MAG: hypothetical protein HYV09_27440 [Deltaproteobacteria bacterium]|nr:hypothetical protein [Deltaproteobacteria bacterium]
MRPLHMAARLAVVAVFALLVLASAREARAYPWMVRHAYTGCAMCHADPTGGGVLTEYGRAQGDLLLRTKYRKVPEGEEGEPSKTAGFLWGALDTPEWLSLGGSVRSALMRNAVTGVPATNRWIHMESDLRAFAKASIFRAGASLGYLHEGGRAAQVTTRAKDNLVGRHYWIGVAFKEDLWLVRAGRMNLPFGVRNVEHTLWVRSATRTDINDGQQHGASVSYNGEKLRGELMAVVGNYQIGPDDYRERGWAGFTEYALGDRWAIGASTLGTWALRDKATGVTTHREAHGLMLRGAPFEQLVLLGEATVLVRAPAGTDTSYGFTSMLQADWEPIQGVHFLITGETLKDARERSKTSLGGWLSAWWFFLPHVDARIDAIVRNVPTPVGDIRATTLLAQLHAYL